jgi:hypothetical protein
LTALCSAKTKRHHHGNQQKQHGLTVPKSRLPLSLSALSVCLSVTSPKSRCSDEQHSGGQDQYGGSEQGELHVVTEHTVYSQQSGQTAITAKQL